MEKKYTSISIDIETYQKLAAIAKKEERSISWVVKKIVGEYASP